MYKIAYYIELNNNMKTLKNADLDMGNPGVGGTPFLFLLTVKYLNRIKGITYSVILSDCDDELNDCEIPLINVGDSYKAIKYCEDNNINILVLNANLIDRLEKTCYQTNINLIFWAHNTLDWKRQCIAAKEDSIKQIVCVSESQCKNMFDTPCASKCVFVNNVLPLSFYDNSCITDYSSPVVVYIGSIMPQKGVHNLLEIWKYVEKKKPDAQLYIFGGAKIWDANIEVGKLGVADVFYDRVIARRLRRLKYKNNVRFWGPKGWNEIDRLIRNARVGVVNPSHYMRDETFCLSAIEMEAHGIPVVSRQRNDGLNTTIVHEKTGYLEDSDKKIANRIIELLSNDNQYRKIGDAAREHSKRFIVENEVGKWIEIASKQYNHDKYTNVIRHRSKDSKLLKHDRLLKILFTIESGKIWSLIKRKIKHR